MNGAVPRGPLREETLGKHLLAVGAAFRAVEKPMAPIGNALIHEAGHAVVMRHLAVPVHAAVIDPRGGGRVFYTAAQQREREPTAMRPVYDHGGLDWVGATFAAAHLAGHLAEYLHAGAPPGPHELLAVESDDLARARGWVGYRPGDSLLPLLACQSIALAALRANWPAVLHGAVLLKAYWRLDADVLARLMDGGPSH